MFSKRYFIAVVLAYVFVFAFDMLFHGQLLKPIYDATMHLWRDVPVMEKMIPFAIAGNIGYLLILGLFFQKFSCCHHGWCKGLKFGLFIASLHVCYHITMYTYFDMPINLLLWWIAGSVFVSIIVGIIFGLILSAKCCEKDKCCEIKD